MRSVYDGIKAVLGIAPIAQTNSEKLSGAIDTLGYNSALVEVQVGAATGTPDSYSVACKVTECATSGGSYSDVSGATATLAADGKHAQIRVEGLGTSRLRYLKISMTPTFVNGTTPKALIGSTVLLGNGYKDPVDNSSTAA
jgi:hypothetical protein